MDINEIESEGNINTIPNSINISNKFIFDSNHTFVYSRQNSLMLNKLEIPSKLCDKDFKINDKINNTVKIEKYKYNLKSEDGNSTTSKSSLNDKLKKVTFSTVEIIRVANYKRYNKLNSMRKVENNKSLLSDNCSIF